MANVSPWELWTLNFQLTTSVLAEVSPRVRTLRLEIKEFFLLSQLDEHANAAALARVLMLPKPSITFMVKNMEAAGYVRRALHPTDLRRFNLTLTASGRRAMEKARVILDEAFGVRLNRLTAPQRAELAKLLRRMSKE
jgi:DNA-binding MarR family transcriptional regulator